MLLQQANAPDAHTSFDLSSGGETWEQNVRRIATDVVRVFCLPISCLHVLQPLSTLLALEFKHASDQLHRHLSLQSRTDCGPENISSEERDAISVRLTHLLTAYAFSDPVVGYCQGKCHCNTLFHCLLLNQLAVQEHGQTTTTT